MKRYFENHLTSDGLDNATIATCLITSASCHILSCTQTFKSDTITPFKRNFRSPRHSGWGRKSKSNLYSILAFMRPWNIYANHETIAACLKSLIFVLLTARSHTTSYLFFAPVFTGHIFAELLLSVNFSSANKYHGWKYMVGLRTTTQLNKIGHRS